MIHHKPKGAKMSDYDEIQSLLTNRPIPKKQVTIGTSARLPVPLFYDIFVMANRGNISRNELVIKLLSAAVATSHRQLLDSGDVDILADLQEAAQELVANFWASHDPSMDVNEEE